MGRYTDSVCRQCRREGENFLLKGDRCYSENVQWKGLIHPGNARKRRQKQSEYGCS